MQRREFLQRLSASALLLQGVAASASAIPTAVGGSANETVESIKNASQENLLTSVGEDLGVKDLLQRARRPDQTYGNDIFVEAGQETVLRALQQRLGRLQKTVGHGNFALLGVDEMRAYGRNYSSVGRFTRAEEALMEQLFYADASSYGFYGSKPLGKLSDRIERRALSRQPGSSQYLFKGDAQLAYAKIKQAMGDELVLTSGVRGVVKQMYLFLSKVVAHDGNLSLASRSLAPPGYSFHAIGDFDVGKRGWGARNFTPEFARTDEFKRLQELGFISMRYPEDNRLGVRYEPWHIRVTKV